MGVVAIGSPYHLVDILLFVRLEALPEEKGLKSSRVVWIHERRGYDYYMSRMCEDGDTNQSANRIAAF